MNKKVISKTNPTSKWRIAARAAATSPKIRIVHNSTTGRLIARTPLPRGPARRTSARLEVFASKLRNYTP